MASIDRKSIFDLLLKNGLIDESHIDHNGNALQLEKISADGSQRHFFRIIKEGKPFVVGVAPSDTKGLHVAEAHAAIAIGTHLYSRGVAVP